MKPTGTTPQTSDATDTGSSDSTESGAVTSKSELSADSTDYSTRLSTLLTRTTSGNQHFTANGNQPSKLTCTSRICQETASKMFSLMDSSADPCSNFYEMACGSHTIEDLGKEQKKEHMYLLLNKKDNTPKYLKDFKTFYTSCVNYNDEYSYSSRMKSLLRLNLTTTFKDLISEMILQQTLPFLDIGIDIQPDSTYVLQLTRPGYSSLKNGVENWNLLHIIKQYCIAKLEPMAKASSANVVNLYEEYEHCQYNTLEKKINNFMKEIDFYGQKNSVNSLNVKTDDILNLFNKTLKGTTEYDLRIEYVHKNYKDENIANMNLAISWDVLFHGTPPTNKDLVQVYFAEYFKDIETIFTQSDQHGGENTYCDIFIAHKPLLPCDKFPFDISFTCEVQFLGLINQLKFIHLLTLYENIVRSNGDLNRNEWCLDMTMQLMPDVVTSAYEFDDDRQNDTITKIFNKLTTRLSNILNDWPDNSMVKDVFLRKLQTIKFSLFSSAEMHQCEKSLDASYQNLILDNKDFMKNVIAVFQNYRKNVFSLINTSTPFSCSMWSYFVSPYTNDPQAFYPNNLIVVPPGIHKTYIDSKDLPEMINLIKTELPIARALSKHFHPAGKTYFDPDDNIVYLANLATNMNFQIEVDNFKTEVKGYLSLNERFADNTALRLVYEEFAENYITFTQLPWISENYDNEKLFFIATAQQYCENLPVLELLQRVKETEILPGSLRVNYLAINSQNWTNAFECAHDSSMDPSAISKIHFPFKNIEIEEGNRFFPEN